MGSTARLAGVGLNVVFLDQEPGGPTGRGGALRYYVHLGLIRPVQLGPAELFFAETRLPKSAPPDMGPA